MTKFGISGDDAFSAQEKTVRLVESGGFQLISYAKVDGPAAGAKRNRGVFEDIGLDPQLAQMSLVDVPTNASISTVIAGQNGKALVFLGRAYVSGKETTVAAFR